jgi:hypothetical protein
MATYTEAKKTAVKELIDKYTADTLDNFVRATVKDAGMKKMDEGASAIEVADAVFDCMNTDFSGNAYMAAACQQICPRSILLVIRHEIIKALK